MKYPILHIVYRNESIQRVMASFIDKSESKIIQRRGNILFNSLGEEHHFVEFSRVEIWSKGRTYFICECYGILWRSGVPFKTVDEELICKTRKQY